MGSQRQFFTGIDFLVNKGHASNCGVAPSSPRRSGTGGGVPLEQPEAGGWRLDWGPLGGQRLTEASWRLEGLEAGGGRQIELVTPSAKARWRIYIYIYIYIYSLLSNLY